MVIGNVGELLYNGYIEKRDGVLKMSLIDLCFVVVSNEKFVVLNEEGGFGDKNKIEVLMGLDYSEEECDVKECDDFEEDDVEKGYLILGNGYKGEICYYGYVKIGGEWFYGDFVNEGWLFKMYDDVDEKLKEIVE